MVTCVGALLAGADPGRLSSEASGRWSKIIRTSTSYSNRTVIYSS